MFFLAMNSVGTYPKEPPALERSFVVSEDDQRAPTSRGRITQTSESSRGSLGASEDTLILENPNRRAPFYNYGSTDEPSPTDITHSFSPASSSQQPVETYQAKGILRKLYPADFPLSLCAPSREQIPEEALPATVLLDPYWENYSFPKYSFAGLLHDLAYFQNYLAPTDFRKQATAAIQEKTKERANLSFFLKEKESCFTAIADHPYIEEEGGSAHDVLPILGAEIKEIKTKIAFIDVFITYHEKLLAVDNYMQRYNELAFYPTLTPEKRGLRFEKAAQELGPALAQSKAANQALLEEIPEDRTNKLTRDLFKKIVAKDNSPNPFDLGLYEGPSSNTRL